MDGLFRTAPSGIGTVIDRVLTEVNDRLCRTTGYAPDEMLGRSARFLYADQDEYERVGREQSGPSSAKEPEPSRHAGSQGRHPDRHPPQLLSDRA